MKDKQFDVRIAAVRPNTYKNDTAFTNAVMRKIAASEIMTSHIRKTNGTKKETLFMKLRHLPKFAIVILAICALFVAAGTTYAVVETVKKLNTVTIDSSGKNEFGREQLQVSFDKCEEEKKDGTTYELKQDSGLSAEDGAKVLQARCEIDTISAWIEQDEQSKRLLDDDMYPIAFRVMSFFSESLRRVKAISDTSIKFERDEAPFPASGRVVADDKVGERDTLKPGDSIFYFNPSFRIGRGTPATAPAEGIVVFKLALEKQYYGHELQSYVKTRKACRENPSLTCLQASNINHVVLSVTRGGYNPPVFDGTPQRELQGKVVSHTDTSIVLDAGGGKLYTIHTPRNVIQKYNTSTVYGLAALDTIYSKTDPEELKIRTGDLLGIGYSEQKDVYATDIPWERLGGIELMVERTVKDIEVLRKY